MNKYSTFSLFNSIFLLIIILILSYSNTFADEIVLKNRAIIECKILQVTPNEIIYKSINSEIKETVQRIQVSKIKYPDGEEIQIEDSANNLLKNEEQENKVPVFMIKNFYEIRGLFLVIEQDKHSENNDSISYIPNSGNNLGASIEYLGFGISYSLSGFNKKNESQYGKTEANDFQLFYYAENYGLDVYFQKYKGFYLTNPKNFNYNIGDPETKRPDLKMSTFGFNFFYNVFDLANYAKTKSNISYLNSFSLLNTFEQIQKQKNGLSISLLLMFSLLHFDIDSSHSLIPVTHQIYYDDYALLKGGEFTSVGLSPGTAITLSYHNAFISVLGFFGGGYMNKKYEMENKTSHQNGTFEKINAKIIIGYNGDMFSYGLKFQMDETDANESNKSIMIKSEIMNVQFFFGYKM